MYMYVVIIYMYMYILCFACPSFPKVYINYMYLYMFGCAVLLCLVCLFDLACFFLSSFSSLIKNMYILGLVFGVIGGFITPAFSFILS